FVLRDQEWELPVESQVLGYMDLDADNNRASFRLALPAVPEGQFNDVDQNGRPDRGVQIFVVGYNPNLTGDVFSAGDDRSLGWPGYLASVTTDSENQDELTGGKLVIWAPDGNQEFPSGFGEDGLLFTSDDPVMAVPAGYSIIDLDAQPFNMIRTQTVEMTLNEPEDLAIKDFSKMSYSQAFDNMFEVIRKEYAFNGISGKQPDWDSVYAEIQPRVRAAEEARDSYAYFLALRDLMLKFEDGHVGLNGGSMAGLYNEENVLGGWGFAVRELDDGRVIVVAVIPGMPAALIGMRVGAEILQINGQPVQQAIENVKPFQPQSTDFGKRKEQTDFLTRGGIGEVMTVEFQNPGVSSQTVEITSIYELDSLFAVYQGGTDDGLKLPTEYYLFPGSNVGVITIHSNYDDLGLLIRIFERALRDFEGAGVSGIVIDMRKNSGGAPLGLAGYLYDEDIPLGQLEYYSDATGKFEPEGPRDKVFPNVNQYRFAKMVVLVDQYCYSACEIEAYGFSQVPGMVVMGQFPTAGVEAEVARGKFLLPEGMEFNIPTGRFTLPDGSIFLEGEGLQLDVRIPVDETSVLSTRDVVLEEAIAFIMGSQ
ncbi:MAG: peptidase S41, partial [Chloroflexi bacterium]|nr:peptidase S41 [Chloroflexota bacterium]